MSETNQILMQNLEELKAEVKRYQDFNKALEKELTRPKKGLIEKVKGFFR